MKNHEQKKEVEKKMVHSAYTPYCCSSSKEVRIETHTGQEP